MRFEICIYWVLILFALTVGIIIGMFVQQSMFAESMENMIEKLNIEEVNINFNETRFADRLDETFRIVFNESGSGEN